MRIIIAGAGAIGMHLAKLLSKEHHAITVIDKDIEKLEYASSHYDVYTLKGDIGSVSVLQAADAEESDLLLAVSQNENDNIVSCILAKKLGAKKTIARVRNPEYIEQQQQQVFAELGVDKLISPTKYAAEEISRLLDQVGSTDHFEFENGKIKLIGVTLDDHSSFVGKSLTEIDQILGEVQFRAIAILRHHHTISPTGSTILQRNDHVYFLTNKRHVDLIIKKLGKQLHKIKNIMIVGGSNLTLPTALALENKYRVTVVEKDKERCKTLVEQLKKALVINTEPSDTEALDEEGLANMDAFIALSHNSEINIVSSLYADSVGVPKTVALVDNMGYTHLSQNMGVDTIINKKIIAANNIFRYVRKGTVEAITSLHGVDAEIIEFVIENDCRITTKPLKDMNFPKDATIGAVIRGEESYIPDGDFQLRNGDKAIVFAMNEEIYEVENFFK